MARPLNIVRIDIDRRNTHGWQVRITRQGVRHTRFFSDSRYGGRDAAYEQAVQYRELRVAEMPERYVGAAPGAKIRAASGVPGVRLSFTGGTPRIDVDTRGGDGVRRVRSFALQKWGLRKALWKACAWRAEVSGVPGVQHVQQLYATAYPRIVQQLEARGGAEAGRDGKAGRRAGGAGASGDA